MQTYDRNDPSVRLARLGDHLRKQGIDPEDPEIRKNARADLERQAVKTKEFFRELRAHLGQVDE